MLIFVLKTFLALFFYYFLPGYLVLEFLLKKNNLKPLHHLTWSFVLSPIVLIAPFCAAVHIFDMRMDIIINIQVYVVLCLILGLVFVKKKQGWVFLKWKSPLKWDLFFTLFLLIISGGLFYVQTSAVNLSLSFHGIYHSSIIYQIQNNIIPPSHTMVYGQSITTYWMYHFNIASISYMFNITPPEASMINNNYALGTTFLLLYCWADIVIKNRTVKWLFPFFVITAGNFMAPVYFLANNIPSAGSCISRHCLEAPLQIKNFFMGEGPYVRARIIGFLIKFYSFNGFPNGIMYMAAIFYSVALNFSSKNHLSLILMFASLLGIWMFHPTTAIVASPIVGLFMVYGLLFITKSNKERMRFAKWIVIGASVLTLILFEYIFSIKQAFKTQEIVFTFSDNYVRLFLVHYWMIIPAFIIGLIFIFKKRDHGLFHLILSLCVLFYFTFYTFLPDNNQYKFYMLIALPFGAIIMFGLDEISKRYGQRAVFKNILVFLSIYILCYFCLFDLVRWNSKLNKSQSPYKYVRRDIEFIDQENDIAKAIKWIRSHTSTRAVLVGLNQDFNTAVLECLSHRRMYAAYGHIHTFDNEEYGRRKRNLRILFYPNNKGKKRILRELATLPDDIYLILRKEDDEQAYHMIREDFSNYQKFLERKYSNSSITIYEIKKRKVRKVALP